MSSIAIGTVVCVSPASRLLGEGPWWSVFERSLYWVDIKRPAILRYSPVTGETTQWICPEPVGSCAPCEGGGMILAMQSGVYTAVLGAPGSILRPKLFVRPADIGDGDRFNDGKCHPDGSFWAGTMDDAEAQARGWFYRIGPGKSIARVAGPYMVCNGPAFSSDGAIAYFTDSARRIIYRCDLSAAMPHAKPFVEFESEEGYPDGMTTDTEGRLWIALWDGSKIVCLDTDGSRICEVALPVSRPTSCAFGGDDFHTLFVSSASIGLTATQQLAQPLAGGLFAIEITGAVGWPSPTFSG